MFSLICAWISGWVNNGEAGDLRRHRAHYNVAVMIASNCLNQCIHNQQDPISREMFKILATKMCVWNLHICLMTTIHYLNHYWLIIKDILCIHPRAILISCSWYGSIASLRWRHNEHAGVSNHQPHGCLLNRLFRRRWKKTSKLRVTGLCEGNSPGPVNSPHKGPVTRKMFPFDDVIMCVRNYYHISQGSMCQPMKRPEYHVTRFRWMTHDGLPWTIHDIDKRSLWWSRRRCFYWWQATPIITSSRHADMAFNYVWLEFFPSLMMVTSLCITKRTKYRFISSSSFSLYEYVTCDWFDWFQFVCTVLFGNWMPFETNGWTLELISPANH